MKKITQKAKKKPRLYLIFHNEWIIVEKRIKKTILRMHIIFIK